MQLADDASAIALQKGDTVGRGPNQLTRLRRRVAASIRTAGPSAGRPMQDIKSGRATKAIAQLVGLVETDGLGIVGNWQAKADMLRAGRAMGRAGPS